MRSTSPVMAVSPAILCEGRRGLADPTAPQAVLLDSAERCPHDHGNRWSFGAMTRAANRSSRAASSSTHPGALLHTPSACWSALIVHGADSIDRRRRFQRGHFEEDRPYPLAELDPAALKRSSPIRTEKPLRGSWTLSRVASWTAAASEVSRCRNAGSVRHSARLEIRAPAQAMGRREEPLAWLDDRNAVDGGLSKEPWDHNLIASA